jgi:hypothetical protein
MNIIQELNESVTQEMRELTAEMVTYVENCEYVLEESITNVTDSALKFLNKFAEEIKGGKVGEPTSKPSAHKFGIFTVLSMLPNAAKVNTLDKVSIRKYLGNDPDMADENVPAIEKTLVNALAKLHTHDNVSGKAQKKHYMDLFASDPKKFHADVMALKKKYSKIKHIQK